MNNKKVESELERDFFFNFELVTERGKNLKRKKICVFLLLLLLFMYMQMHSFTKSPN